MTAQADPFRVLGVAPGSSEGEIKQAYRRLVKQFHPDAAGERALGRFLAIQAAYEALIDGEGHLRGRGPGARAGSPGGPARAAGWRADPARARATRAGYRARRGAGAAGPVSGRPTGTRRPDADARAEPGAAGRPGADTRGGADGTRGRGRGRRAATPGSTTYDEAADQPRDPDWSGGDWYGTTSGTYWTINPREYADPRKHGPEYEARARRAMDERGRAEADEPPPPNEPAAPEARAAGAGAAWHWTTDSPGGGRDDTAEGSTAAADGTGWTARDWRFRSGRADARPSGTAVASGPDLEALARRLSPGSLRHEAARGGTRRLLVALAAWPPIGVGVASLADLATGCGGFAAACAEPASLLPLAAQPVVLAVLLLVPALSAAAAFASLAALATAVPIAVALSASGAETETGEARAILAAAVALAYVLALGVAAVGVPRTGPEADPGA